MDDPGHLFASRSPTERTAVLLIAHGSREPAANDDLHALADRLAATSENPIVVACFLELAEPDIPTGGERCVARGATRVLMIPYFLSAGVHLRRDLTAAREELERRHPGVAFRLGPALGPHPLLDELIAARIHEMDRAEPRSDLARDGGFA
jgi:sirohydrochlorin ferrochelatase